MNVKRSHFLYITIACFFNLFLFIYKGIDLAVIPKLFVNAKNMMLTVPFLVLVYRALMFIYRVSIGLYRYNVSYFNHWHYDLNDLLKDVLNTIVVCLFATYLMLFQSSIKNIYTWMLVTPNNVDWLLSTLDRVFVGPPLWWWGSQLLPNTIWLGVLFFIDRFYLFYFFLQWFVLMYLCFDDRSKHKEYFVTVFCLIWIYGTTLGGICQSGGPFYFVRSIWNLMQMQALLAIHNVMPLYAIDLQGFLWHSYFNPSLYVFGGGISAFPSLHVAMCLFVYMYSKTFHKPYLSKLVFIGFVLTIIGSSVLGWHYLTDSLGAVFVVCLASKTATALHKS